MDKKIRYTLGKKERLKSRKTIGQLFAEGRSLSVFPFRILYKITTQDPALTNDKASTPAADLQTGFTVSSRHFKKAVDRNRVKRLMREAWRLQKNELQLLPALSNTTIRIFIIYIGKELPEYKWVYEKTGLILKRLIQLSGENK